jgi:hypothetical protein
VPKIDHLKSHVIRFFDTLDDRDDDDDYMYQYESTTASRFIRADKPKPEKRPRLAVFGDIAAGNKLISTATAVPRAITFLQTTALVVNPSPFVASVGFQWLAPL